jgi:hypothetical protein
MFKHFGDYWCWQMHTRTTWPMHGRYICRQCGREYRVNWDHDPPLEAPKSGSLFSFQFARMAVCALASTLSREVH